MYDYPTILVARDDGLDCRLVQSLQRNGFHVLEADDWEQVFHAVRVHSRPIHLLLVDVSMDAHVPMLKAAPIRVAGRVRPKSPSMRMWCWRRSDNFSVRRRLRLQFADGWFIGCTLLALEECFRKDDFA